MHKIFFRCAILLLLGLWLTETAPIPTTAQNCPLPPQINRVSLATDGLATDGRSNWPSLSANGNFIAFESLASNLIAGDTNNLRDIFVYDRDSAQTSRALAALDGGDPNAHVFAADVSEDGRYVAFESWASNLVANDSQNITDVFVRDRQSGQTSRVSVASNGAQGDGESASPQISGDGRYVVYDSMASNLVAGDTNGSRDVFLYDRQTGQTSFISAGGNASSLHPAISADGRFIAFISFANNLVAGDSDNLADLYLYDRQNSTLVRVVMSSTLAGSDRDPIYPSLSGDGRFVAFESEANILVASDANDLTDVFVYDRQAGTLAIASAAPNGEAANGPSTQPRLSADGDIIAFASAANNLTAGDTNNLSDIFVRDLQTGQLRRLTVNGVCLESNGASYTPDISADGHYVAFTSEATNLVPSYDVPCKGERCAGVYVALLEFEPTVIDAPGVAPVRNFFKGDVHLSWYDLSWATHYHIQVSQDPLFKGTLNVDQVVEASVLSLDLNDIPAGTYYWRIQAQQPTDVWSAWSKTEAFVVK